MSSAVDEIVVLRRQNEALSDRVAYLEGKLSVLAEECPPEWKLSGIEARIMGILMRASGRIVGRGTLISAVWDEREPDTANRCLHVHIFRIRKKVAPFGLKIRTMWGTGLRVERVLSNLEAAQ